MIKITNDEKKLINFIRYGAICLIVIFSFFITDIFIKEKNEYMQKEFQNIEDSYISKNKILIEK